MTEGAPVRTPRGRSSRLVGGAALLVALAVVIVGGWRILGDGASARRGPSPEASLAATGARPSSSATTAASGAAAPSATSPGPTPSPPTPEPTPVLVPAPLTGLPVSPESAARHPIAVMIDDHRDARPQSGFNAASVVWQAPAEGGIPRYMLIFQDRVPTVLGPVRSSRQYFIEWAAEWDAVYVHAGGSPQALATLAAKGRGAWVYNADAIRFEGRYLYRVTEHQAPHNLYTNADKLLAMAATVGARDGTVEPAWTFAPDADWQLRPDPGRIVVTYPYETITYRYDRGRNAYLRYVDGSKKPQVDRADGQIVAPKNVVILRMRFGPLNDGHPAKQRLEAHDVGSGEAWVSTNGRTLKATWRKASPTAPTLLFDASGAPITLTAGQTFVQVLPLTYRFTIADGLPPDVRGR